VTSTFVYREIEALRRLGAEVETFSTHRPHDSVVSEEAVPLVGATRYLYDTPPGNILREAAALAVHAPGRFLRGLGRALRDAVAAEVPGIADRAKLLWHFGVGCALARDLEARGVRHLHAHFAHVPTAIAMYAAGLAGIPYSFTCHANDIFERPTALREKVARAGFAACISDYNRRHLIERGCDPERLCIVRCALDVENYSWEEPKRDRPRPLLYSVGRLVEKKGMAVLVDALRILRDRGRDFACKVVGGGPLTDALRRQIEDAGLQDRVELLGSQPQERVKALFREADIFVLPCVVAASGDRDGIPVALMEAMALGVPVVSTTVSGIPELIESGKNGLLAEPGDAASLAETLEHLLSDPELVRELSRNARNTLETTFESGRNATILWEKIHECANNPR
jgi:colanic acid/amylovoran biosynthesis glycosyltransferase